MSMFDKLTLWNSQGTYYLFYFMHEEIEMERTSLTCLSAQTNK